MEVAWAQARGPRAHMEDYLHVEHPFLGREDALYAGVFDGHGGPEVARRASEEMHGRLAAALDRSAPAIAFARAFASFDETVADVDAGAVAAVALLEGTTLWVANAGDATVLLVSHARERVLTADHRLTNGVERRRIVAAGGVIDFPYTMLRDGRGLMPTRALGDHEFRGVGILAEPEVSSVELTPEDAWILAGTDGVFDALDAPAAAGFARGSPTAKVAAERIRDAALETGDDNVSVVAIRR